MRIISNRIGAGKQATVHQTEDIYSAFAVIPPVIANLTDRICKNHRAKRQRNTMLGQIGRILGLVELDIHDIAYGKPVCSSSAINTNSGSKAPANR